MADISAIFERLKNNKFALPALGIGVIAGGYMLLKNGGLGSSGNSGIAAAQQAISDAEEIASGVGGGSGGGSGGGGVDTGSMDAIGEIIDGQKSFQDSITDYINNAIKGIESAFGNQQSGIDAALGNLQAQQQGLADQLAQGASAGVGAANQYLPDLSAITQSLQAIPYLNAPQSIPGISGSVGSKGNPAGIGGGTLGKIQMKFPQINAPVTPSAIVTPRSSILGGRVNLGNLGKIKPPVRAPINPVKAPRRLPYQLPTLIKNPPGAKPVSRIVAPKRPVAAPRIKIGGGGSLQRK